MSPVDKSICEHCGKQLTLAGEYTVFYEAWDTWNVEASVSPDGEVVVDTRWGPKGEDGSTTSQEFDWKRTCCDAMLTNKDDIELDLYGNSEIFTME